MATTKKRRKVLRVVVDDQLDQDLREARGVTGIRGTSDLVRHALRQLVKRPPQEAT